MPMRACTNTAARTNGAAPAARPQAGHRSLLSEERPPTEQCRHYSFPRRHRHVWPHTPTPTPAPAPAHAPAPTPAPAPGGGLSGGSRAAFSCTSQPRGAARPSPVPSPPAPAGAPPALGRARAHARAWRAYVARSPHCPDPGSASGAPIHNPRAPKGARALVSLRRRAVGRAAGTATNTRYMARRLQQPAGCGAPACTDTTPLPSLVVKTGHTNLPHAARPPTPRRVPHSAPLRPPCTALPAAPPGAAPGRPAAGPTAMAGLRLHAGRVAVEFVLQSFFLSFGPGVCSSAKGGVARHRSCQ